MNEHAWLIAVVDDLALYGRAHGLTTLATSLEHLREVAAEEIGAELPSADSRHDPDPLGH